MNDTIAQFAGKVLAGASPSRDEALALADAGVADPHELMYWAHKVRLANFGKAVSFCSIAAGRLGGCSEDCKWCAQSAQSSQELCKPAFTPKEDILAAAGQAIDCGVECFCIVNSGKKPSPGELEKVLDAMSDLGKLKNSTLCLSASLGELNDEQAAALKAAGVRRYNHNLESSRRHYANVVSTHSYDDRLRTLATARRAGIALCCGGIFGVGETWEDRVDLALTLRDEVQPEVTPLNFLHPIPGTPLADAKQLQPLEILSIIAMFRLLLPKVDLKIAGGRTLNLRDLQSWVFYAGATSCISGNLLTTTGRTIQQDMQMIEDLGLEFVPQIKKRH